MSATHLRYLTRSLALVASAGVLVLSGCGIGNLASPSQNVATASVGGMIHGGASPIVGATVTLYATQSNGYGGAAVQLGNTATSQSDGSFSFVNSTAYSCPTGQQAYVTVSGGNAGAGPNTNILLMAAIGDCSKLAVGTRNNVYLWIDELSTVAAAYALNNFITISGAAVNISAPGNANSTSGSCVVNGSNVTTSCTTASLAHAFLNAANLVNSVGTNSAPPTGTAYTVPPSNSTGAVPQALLNTLGNILQYCVNSTSAVGNCSSLYTAATPSGGVTPANTLQAMMNIARYPSRNVATLYGFAPATSASYLPALTSSPIDFSVAIVYTGTSAATFGYPYFVTLDINDRVYTATQPTSSNNPVTVDALGSNGASVFTGATVTNAKCAAASPCYMATDTLGNIWLPNTNTTSFPNIYKVSATDGSLIMTYGLTSTDAPNGAAVNPLNTVYITSAATANANLFQLAPADTTFSAVTYTPTAGSPTQVTETVAPEAIAIDSNLDIQNINYTSASTGSTYIPNTSTYNPATPVAPTFGSPVTATESTTLAPYNIMIDGSNNAWVNSTKALYAVPRNSTTPTLTATITTTNGLGATVTPSGARYGALDGTGTIFLPDNNTTSSYLYEYIPNSIAPTTVAGVFYAVNPCQIASGATTCSNGTGTNPHPALYGSRNAQIDSTGSIWIASSTNGSIVQVLGLAAPTWPQLSYAKPGVKPQ